MIGGGINLIKGGSFAEGWNSGAATGAIVGAAAGGALGGYAGGAAGSAVGSSAAQGVAAYKTANMMLICGIGLAFLAIYAGYLSLSAIDIINTGPATPAPSGTPGQTADVNSCPASGGLGYAATAIA
ncbi:MAG: hypothetical protein NDJ90_00970 [Oligoflexia bacterium]|nr:hypothetical protein [Oligoflexia bacterium]